ncbi:hypothetical protein R83H12_02088 [Fibrobacteria bacterium R8-3-H12]
MAEKTTALSLQAVKRSSNRASLEEKFEKHKIQKKQRIDLLLKAMGNPAVSYSCEFPSVDDRYEILLNSFLAGVWKENYSSLRAKGKLETL